MSTQVQYRRGTATENNAFTGALAEITVDTTNLTLRVHDGLTAGGSNIATVAYVTAQISSLSSNSITDGTSNVKVFNNGNVAITVGGTANVGIFTATGANIAGTLNATGNANVGNLGTAGLIISTGNVTGGNLVTAGLLSVNSGNSAGTVITNAGGNGVGNIGSASGFFNTAHVKATSAQYADLAEKYIADQFYQPGTVLEIGGPAEVTATSSLRSTRIAGVVSTNPAFIMNSGENNINAVEIALLGRVPCRVVGTINRGDLLCSSDIVGVATSDPTPTVGSIVGKALESYDSNDIGVIEVLVGKV
jgi:hypothetical protein